MGHGCPCSGKKGVDRPEKGIHGKTHPDNAQDQISNQSDIHQPRNF